MPIPKSSVAIRSALAKTRDVLRKTQARIRELERALAKTSKSSKKTLTGEPKASKVDLSTFDLARRNNWPAIYRVEELVRGAWLRRLDLGTRSGAEKYAEEQSQYARGKYRVREISIPLSVKKASSKPHSYLDRLGQGSDKA